MNSSFGLNISLSVSYDYEKDVNIYLKYLNYLFN